ncbi:MAG: antitoxin, partial [Candidatus Microthrix parvicella]
MSFLDDAKKKLDDVVDEHGDKIADGVEKAGDFIDEKTGGKHADKVDMVQEKAGDAIDSLRN